MSSTFLLRTLNDWTKNWKWFRPSVFFVPEPSLFIIMIDGAVLSTREFAKIISASMSEANFLLSKHKLNWSINVLYYNLFYFCIWLRSGHATLIRFISYISYFRVCKTLLLLAPIYLQLWDLLKEPNSAVNLTGP